MFKELTTILYTNPFTGGFCDECETTRFRIEIYDNGREYEALIFYFDHFTMTVPSPIKLADGKKISEVSKDLIVYEDFLTTYPAPLIDTSIDSLKRKIQERFTHHSFILYAEDGYGTFEC